MIQSQCCDKTIVQQTLQNKRGASPEHLCKNLGYTAAIANRIHDPRAAVGTVCLSNSAIAFLLLSVRPSSRRKSQSEFWAPQQLAIVIEQKRVPESFQESYSRFECHRRRSSPQKNQRPKFSILRFRCASSRDYSRSLQNESVQLDFQSPPALCRLPDLRVAFHSGQESGLVGRTEARTVQVTGRVQVSF